MGKIGERLNLSMRPSESPSRHRWKSPITLVQLLWFHEVWRKQREHVCPNRNSQTLTKKKIAFILRNWEHIHLWMSFNRKAKSKCISLKLISSLNNQIIIIKYSFNYKFQCWLNGPNVWSRERLAIPRNLSLADLTHGLDCISSIQIPYDNHSNSPGIILIKALAIIWIGYTYR